MENVKDDTTTKIQGHVLIRDPETGEVFVNKSLQAPKKVKDTK